MRSWKRQPSSGGFVQKSCHLIFAKLAKMDQRRWGEVAEREAQYNPKIEQARKRIDCRDIKEVAMGKWFKLDCLIAENYFRRQKLGKPLRELSAEKASIEIE